MPAIVPGARPRCTQGRRLLVESECQCLQQRIAGIEVPHTLCVDCTVWSYADSLCPSLWLNSPRADKAVRGTAIANADLAPAKQTLIGYCDACLPTAQSLPVSPYWEFGTSRWQLENQITSFQRRPKDREKTVKRSRSQIART